jgi:hypothetical protein
MNFRYVQKLYGYYPYIPVIYDQISEIPMIPKNRDADIDSILFAATDNVNPATIVNFTVKDYGIRNMADDGNCATVLDQSSDSQDLEIGAPNDASQYPSSYWSDRQKWLQEVIATEGSGQCKLSITEIWTCEDAAQNLYATFSIAGTDGSNLYTSPQSASAPGVPINANDPLSVQEQGMGNAIVITGEHSSNYIQFSYGAASWTSGVTTGDNYCTLNGNDWNEGGPTCPGMAETRQFECVYQC